MKEKISVARKEFERREFAKSLEHYQEAISSQPDNLDAYLGAAKCLCAMKKMESAIAMCEKMLEIDTNFIMARVIMAEAYYELNETAKSRNSIELAYALEPTHPNVLSSYAVLLFRDNKLDEAISLLEAAVLQDSNMYDVYYYLGVAYERKGDTGKVFLYAKKIFELKPSLRNRVRLLIAKMNNLKFYRPLIVATTIIFIVSVFFREWWLLGLASFILILPIIVRIYLRNP